jgi:nitroreductase
MFDESASVACVRRYGHDLEGVPELGKFLNHRSVRKYKTEPIPESVIRGLIGCAQSAATSSNLQLWSVISVQDPERRDQIATLCGDQKQIRDASWFLGFFADHHRLRLAAAAVGEDAIGLDFEEFYTMAVIDASLAAERLVCAAESLGIGICYIGALRNDPFAVKEIFGLPEGVFGVFGLCLGWPEEPMTSEIKPRLAQEAVWFRERYVADVSNHVTEYDNRMRGFYEGQNMKGEVTWSMRSGKRVDENHLTGREAIRDFLNEQGMALR